MGSRWEPSRDSSYSNSKRPSHNDKCNGHSPKEKIDLLLRLDCSSCPGWQIDASFQLITGEWLAKGLWVCVLVCFDVLPEPGIAGWGLGSFTHSLSDLLFCPSLLLHTIYIPDDNGYSFPMANCWSGNGKVKSIFRRGNRFQVPHW